MRRARHLPIAPEIKGSKATTTTKSGPASVVTICTFQEPKHLGGRPEPNRFEWAVVYAVEK